MSVADFLVERVKSKGWLSVGCIYADNNYPLFPFIDKGFVCLSESKQVIIGTSRYDSTISSGLNNYLVSNIQQVGFQKTLVVVGFEHIQHFDINLFQNEGFLDSAEAGIVLPNVPTPATIDGITLDPDTGLADGYSTAQTLEGKQFSVIDLYPEDTTIDKVVGLRIKEAKTFYENQKKFAAAMNAFLGLTDCI